MKNKLTLNHVFICVCSRGCSFQLVGGRLRTRSDPDILGWSTNRYPAVCLQSAGQLSGSKSLLQLWCRLRPMVLYFGTANVNYFGITPGCKFWGLFKSGFLILLVLKENSFCYCIMESRTSVSLHFENTCMSLRFFYKLIWLLHMTSCHTEQQRAIKQQIQRYLNVSLFLLSTPFLFKSFHPPCKQFCI